MKILIFGATGQIGRQLLEQSLERGHSVTAFTRDTSKVKCSHRSLQCIQGDVLDPKSVLRAMESQEIVLCALGMPIRNKEGAREIGTKNIVQAMEACGVKRLICLSALGVGKSREILPFHYKYFLIPLFMSRVYADHQGQEEVVTGTQLDWTIVRPGGFTKGEKTGQYQHGFGKADKSLRFKISHADVADFMIGQVAKDQYLRKRPNLSY